MKQNYRAQNFSALLVVVMLVLFALPLGACSKNKEDFSDTYNAETDFPLDGLRFMGSPVAGVDGGCYLVAGRFLLYLPDGSDEAVCVCSKPNCEHYKASNLDKYLKCDAYIPGLAMIRSINNELYALANSQIPNKDGTFNAAVYQISTDGSQRDKLLEIPDSGNMDISNFAIHRGYVYFIGSWYEQNGTLYCGVYRYSMTDKSSEVEVLYKSENQYAVSLQCYGKYIYFDTYTSGVFTDYHTMQYNLQTKKLSKFFTDAENVEVVSPRYWNGKFFITKTIVQSSTEIKPTYYLTDLNGNNPQSFSAIKPPVGGLACDGKYLYLSNQVNRNDGETPLIVAYDEKENKIASLNLPFDGIHFSEDGSARVDTEFWANGRIFFVNAYNSYSIYSANSADFSITGEIEPKLVFTNAIDEHNYIDLVIGEIVGHD